MSNARHKHNINVRFKETPIAPVDIIEKDGKVVGIRKMDHSVGNAVLHPTKGWRKIRNTPPMYLLGSLLLPLGIVPPQV